MPLRSCFLGMTLDWTCGSKKYKANKTTRMGGKKRESERVKKDGAARIRKRERGAFLFSYNKVSLLRRKVSRVMFAGKTDAAHFDL